ncbi:MAG: site-2 protease family protein [Tannerella sp.]|jgi:Zn-dependent protease|nr:site-2 protease family protein [Tannerella sp.]
MDIQQILFSLPGIIIGFTVHEYAHALAACKLGDTTVREDGRLTLNPMNHIDIVGLIFIIFAGFGWAKPVRFHPDMLKHPKRDKAIIAAVGPLSNLILGILFILVLKSLHLLHTDAGTIDAVSFTAKVLFYWGFINIGLFLFNMLPIPPLDGSHIFLSGLKIRKETETKIMQTGSGIFFLILIIQSTSGYNVLPIGAVINRMIALIL